MMLKIKQVSEELGVPVSTIRFWQKEFAEFVSPERTDGGQRRYSEGDLAALVQIKDLVYGKKMPIDLAREKLKRKQSG